MALSREVAKLTLSLDGDLAQNARIHRITQVCGGRKVNTATFELVDLTLNNQQWRTQLENRPISDLFENKICQISVKDRNGNDVVLHYGKVLAGNISLNEKGESVILESRLDPFMFGRPLDQIVTAVRPLDVASTAEAQWYEPTTIDGETVFNPVFDDVIMPNMWASVHSSRGVQTRIFINPLSIHPKTLEDERKILEQNGNRGSVCQFWTLPDAVYYLCATLNAGETYVLNPNPNDLLRVVNSDPSILRNVEIPKGERLPAALDRLLTPYGYGHLVRFRNDKPIIEIYRRGGTGEAIGLQLQKFGEHVNDALSQVWKLDMEFDMSESAANEIDVLGHVHEREGTFELIPAWPTDWDKLSEGDGDPNEIFNSNADGWEKNPDQQIAWRKWVLNESGDYIGVRDEIKKAFDVNAFFNEINCVNDVRRRRFRSTLTLNRDGTTRGDSGTGVLVEYWNPEFEEWIDVRGKRDEEEDKAIGGLDGGANIQVLENECGIYFSNLTKFPQQLHDIASIHGMDSVKIRVTARIESDCLLRTRRVEQHSFLKQTKRVVIDTGKSFPSRRIEREGENKSRLSDDVDNGTLLSAESEDFVRLNRLADELINNWGHGSVNGSATIDGIDFDFSSYRGKGVWGLFGRAFTFGTTPDNRPEVRYPTIEQIVYMPQEQITNITLSTVRGRGK